NTICTMFQGVINIEPFYGPGGCGQLVPGPGEYEGGTIVRFRKPGCYDAYNSLMPVFVIDHRGKFFLLHPVCDLLQGFFGYLFVEQPSVRIEDLDFLRELYCCLKIGFREEVYGMQAVFHTSCGIDSRGNDENHIRYIQLLFVEGMDYCLNTCPGPGIYLLKPEMGKYPVLSGNRNDVGSNGRRHQ